MAGIRDIAKSCNVSIATVSNILNGKGGAGEATKQLVLKTAEALNYKPNYMAKNLKQRQTRTVGVITEDLTVFTTPEIVDGINEYCEQNQYQIILGNLRLYKKYHSFYYESDEYMAQVKNEIQEMLAKQVEGILYVGGHERELPFLTDRLPVPLAIAYGFTRDERVPAVVVDDEQGAFDGVARLIQSGHKKIGVIAGEENSFHMQARLMGYQKALYENKILYNPSLVEYGDWGRRSGREAAGRLMKRGVTAVFCMNDMMAGGVYEYLAGQRLTAGRDVSLVGFDNREFSAWFKPALTTVELPLHEIGCRAASVMLDLLKGKQADRHMYHVACTLAERESVGIYGGGE